MRNEFWIKDDLSETFVVAPWKMGRDCNAIHVREVLEGEVTITREQMARIMFEVASTRDDYQEQMIADKLNELFGVSK